MNLVRDFKAETNALESGIKSLRTASVSEYAAFLCTHLENGGKISHTYDYAFERADIKIATNSASIPKGIGVKAINVIVPQGIDITRVGNDEDENPAIKSIGGHDHGNSYLMEDGSVSSVTGGWTPIYPNVAAEMIKLGWKFEQSEFGSNTDKMAVNMLINNRADFQTTPYDSNAIISKM